jgi:hypothetical protein
VDHIGNYNTLGNDSQSIYKDFSISNSPNMTVMSTSRSTLGTSFSLPSKYKDLSDVFEKKNVDLPEHRKFDYPIDLKVGASPPFDPIYGLSEPKLEALRIYIEENLTKGFICHSKSRIGSSILFVKKKDATLRSVSTIVGSIGSLFKIATNYG